MVVEEPAGLGGILQGSQILDPIAGVEVDNFAFGSEQRLYFGLVNVAAGNVAVALVGGDSGGGLLEVAHDAHGLLYPVFYHFG